ncbi:MAG TPA: tetratricopeptide repeat protein [Gemmatimonadales bacterium]|nr:tetratricopeptide repeat protein [Gemmatimonadales bacterium]
MATTLTAPETASVPSSARFVAWSQAHRKLLMIVGGVVLAAGLVAWFLVTASARREDFANRSLSQARGIAESGNIVLASTEFQKLIDTYPGTAASREAEISLNQLRLISGQHELAIVRLREFLKADLPAKYKAAGNALLGAALENALKPAEAGEAYKAAADAADLDYLKADYLLQAARAYGAGGKNADAIAALKTVIDKYSKTPALTEAQVRLGELTKGEM